MSIALNIPGGEKVVKIFDRWPTFRNAEVKWLHLDSLDAQGGPGPVLEMAVHCFDMTNELGPTGNYVLRNHTLVLFRFREIMELHLKDFGRLNTINGLDIVPESDPEWDHPYFRVTVEPAMGMSATFHAVYPEVISAVPCNARGQAL
jgi:hypothetical protein